MNYFVGAYFNSQLTGIEKAQVNRIGLFAAQGWPAKCLYTKYNPRIHENAEKFGLQGKCFTLYDYFQETTTDQCEASVDWIHFWQDVCHFRVEFVDIAPDVRVFDEHERFIMYAHFTGQDYQWPIYINYFDCDHKKVQRDIYDSRGFLSQSKFLKEQQRVQSEVFFNRQGQIKIEKMYQEVNDRTVLKRIILRDFRKRDWFFDTEMELQTFFFDSLFMAGDIYFCDKNGYIGQAMANTASSVTVCAVFHSTHTRDQDNVLESPLKSPYRVPLTQPEKFNRFIVSTELQKRDLLARFDQLPPIAVIPVGYVRKAKVNLFEKKAHRIIGVARFSQEKQVLHQIQVVERLVTEFPDVELHLFGFGSRVEEQKLRDYVDKHNLERHVFFRGFVSDLSREYAQASLEMVTSKEEGFSLTVLEALSYGVPVISYDINYGPNEMVKDGVNGNLVERDKLELLYQRAREYFSDPERQHNYKLNSLQIAKTYSEVAITKKWENLLTDINL
ncbi:MULTISPECIES: glycosyltransferase [Lactobacillaceae]|uniref:glycosyltransferase n=1 Tax=Lactobacillaceae TaxID=33958 RepID=UPI0014574925|nr:glycosyltransferase [Lactobacillus sp. HBUAS51381]NLR09344.1 glycosyltransferase [Lactobacillus sp. HBUAS51381]